MGLIDPAETLTGRQSVRPHPGDRGPAGIRRLVRQRAAARPRSRLRRYVRGSAGARARRRFRPDRGVSLGMRGFDGLRLCSQLRSLPEGRNVPILVVVSRRRPPQADPGAGNGRQRLSHPPGGQERTGGARAHPAAQEALCRPAAPQCAAQPGNGDHRPAHRPAQSPLYEPAISTLWWRSAKKNGKPLAFVIMDIDYFKAVNDTHGHDIGDEVLKEFASRIAANVRGIDLACRYGGEEFVVVMPDTDVGLRLCRSPSGCARASRPRRSRSAARRASSTSPSPSASPASEGESDTRRGAAAPRRPGALPRQAQRPQPRRGRRGVANSRAIYGRLC